MFSKEFLLSCFTLHGFARKTPANFSSIGFRKIVTEFDGLRNHEILEMLGAVADHLTPGTPVVLDGHSSITEAVKLLPVTGACR